MKLDTNFLNKYFNEENTVFVSGTTTTSFNGDDFSAILLMRSEHDRVNDYTIEFVLKFEHKKYGEVGSILQKEFKIEHHTDDKSKHIKPHVQLHIHGPLVDNKIGEMWINLDLKDETEYLKCIEGFFYLLEEVINLCEDGIAGNILNIEEVKKLDVEKKILLDKINHSLQNNEIEYKDPNGKTTILNPRRMRRIVDKDNTLLPFFSS